MPLVPANMASLYDNAMVSLMSPPGTPSQLQILTEFCNAYDNHAKTGICITLTISGTGKTAMLSALTVSGSASANILTLGNALAAYWTAEITPLAPHTSVTNNASTMGSAFASAIQTSIDSQSAASTTSILSLISETDNIVKTIIYTGIIPGTPPVLVPASVS